MNKRLRELRKKLKMNQNDFSKKIKIGSSTLALLETGQRNIKDIHIAQICTTFNVNEEWFRTGKGKMFVDTPDSVLEELSLKYGFSQIEYNILKEYLSLDNDTRKSIANFLTRCFVYKTDEDKNEDTSTIGNGNFGTIPEEDVLYKKYTSNNKHDKKAE